MKDICCIVGTRPNLIKLNLTFDPPWNPEQHVSDEAKYQMGLL